MERAEVETGGCAQKVPGAGTPKPRSDRPSGDESVPRAPKAKKKGEGKVEIGCPRCGGKNLERFQVRQNKGRDGCSSCNPAKRVLLETLRWQGCKSCKWGKHKRSSCSEKKHDLIVPQKFELEYISEHSTDVHQICRADALLKRLADGKGPPPLVSQPTGHSSGQSPPVETNDPEDRSMSPKTQEEGVFQGSVGGNQDTHASNQAPSMPSDTEQTLSQGNDQPQEAQKSAHKIPLEKVGDASMTFREFRRDVQGGNKFTGKLNWAYGPNGCTGVLLVNRGDIQQLVCHPHKARIAGNNWRAAFLTHTGTEKAKDWMKMHVSNPRRTEVMRELEADPFATEKGAGLAAPSAVAPIVGVKVGPELQETTTKPKPSSPPKAAATPKPADSVNTAMREGAGALEGMRKQQHFTDRGDSPGADSRPRKRPKPEPPSKEPAVRLATVPEVSGEAVTGGVASAPQIDEVGAASGACPPESPKEAAAESAPREAERARSDGSDSRPTARELPAARKGSQVSAKTVRHDAHGSEPAVVSGAAHRSGSTADPGDQQPPLQKDTPKTGPGDQKLEHLEDLLLGGEEATPEGLKKWRNGNPVPRDRQLRAWLTGVCTKVGFPMEKTMPMMLKIPKALRNSQRAGPQQDAGQDEAAEVLYETLCDLSEMLYLPDESVMKLCVTGALDQLHSTVCK